MEFQWCKNITNWLAASLEEHPGCDSWPDQGLLIWSGPPGALVSFHITKTFELCQFVAPNCPKVWLEWNLSALWWTEFHRRRISHESTHLQIRRPDETNEVLPWICQMCSRKNTQNVWATGRKKKLTTATTGFLRRQLVCQISGLVLDLLTVMLNFMLEIWLI